MAELSQFLELYPGEAGVQRRGPAVHSRTLGELGAEQGPPISPLVAVVRALGQILDGEWVHCKYLLSTPSKKVMSTLEGWQGIPQPTTGLGVQTTISLAARQCYSHPELPVGAG